MKNLSNTTAASPVVEEKAIQGADKQSPYSTFELILICLVLIVFAVGTSLIP